MIRGVITGLLPTILLSVLMSVLPIVLRRELKSGSKHDQVSNMVVVMARLGGDPSLSAVELTVQNTYFAFQIVHVFFVTTLGSAASSAVGKIAQHPGSVPSLLAQSIPTASNFYLSYIIL